MSEYLTKLEIASLVEAIKTAEHLSTGELCLHIDSKTRKNHAQLAFKIFKSECMNKTQEKNAVLFYVNFKQKHLSIIGDEGIHKKVSQIFWEQLRDKTMAQFSIGNYSQGLEHALLETGTELKKHFPILNENPNELPDDITFS